MRPKTYQHNHVHVRTPRQGIFLIIVLVVIAVATMAAYSFTDTMLAYDEASHLSSDQIQTQAAADSGAEAVRMILSQTAVSRDEMGGTADNPALFQAVNIVSIQDGGRACNFSIVAPGMDETGRLGGIRFGLQNESSRLNINALITLEENSSALTGMVALAAATGVGAEATDELASDNIASSLLLALPGMTTDIADCILDWLDKDDEPRPYGAEVEYYSTLPSPYKPANGSINSVEDLLLVRGVTPSLMFGIDVNRNGVVDAAEQQSGGVDINALTSLGWASYITVNGLESNRRRDGSPRVHLNQTDLELLYEEIGGVVENEDYATFIAAYRVYGKPAATAAGTLQSGAATSGGGSNSRSGSSSGSTSTSGNASTRGGATSGGTTSGGTTSGGTTSGGGNTSGGNSGSAISTGSSAGGSSSNQPKLWTAEAFEQVDLTAGAGTTVAQLLDLIDATVTIGSGNNAPVYTSPFTSDPIQMALYMPLLMENFSTQDFETMPGRININDCPAELLMGIPLLGEETANAIIEARSEPSQSENRLYETWPLVEGVVTLAQMRSLMPLVTAGGDVYRAQIVGYYEGTAASTRVEVIVDATTVNPKIIHYRDLSHLGRGFDLSVLGMRNALTAEIGNEGN